MKSEISFCFRGTVLAYFKVYRIIRRHYNQIQGSGLFQNFSPPSIDLAKYNKPVASMLCILLLFSICVLLRVISTTVSEYVNMNMFFLTICYIRILVGRSQLLKN